MKLHFTALTLCLFGFAALGETAPEPLTVKVGSAKFGAILNVWALNDTTAANDAASNFRMRRAEIKFSGSVYPKTRWFLMVDPSKSPSLSTTGTLSSSNDNKILEDLGVGFQLTEELEVVLGQFKIPTMAESLQSSSETLMPERSYIARYFGLRREPGLMLDYNLKPYRVRVMASNGQVTPGGAGTNLEDTNGSKDINARGDYSIGEEVKLGLFASQSHAVVGISNRYGGDVEFARGQWLARLSGLQARELDLDRNGMSLDVGYQLNDILNDSYQAVARYENFQQTNGTEISSTISTLGLNYFLQGHNAKIQLAHSFIHNMLGSNGSPRPTANRDGSVTILGVQMAL